MKKKILFGALLLLTIVCGVLLFTDEVQPIEEDVVNSSSVTEQDLSVDKEPSGDGMIWELSRHFITVN